MSTPRTDAELIMAGYAPYCVVPTSFARQLEREVESLSAQVAELKKDAERMPIAWIIAVEEYGQMVAYGPQYRIRESAERDAALPRMRGQNTQVWACYADAAKESGDG